MLGKCFSSKKSRVYHERLFFIIGLIVTTQTWGATYYIDSESGADSNCGQSPRMAWNSLQRVNQEVFQPGDTILFKVGTVYRGQQLNLHGSGSKAEPIIVDMYGDDYSGEKDKPHIEGRGEYLDTVLVRNVECWEINNLQVSNLGQNREEWRTGIRIVSDGAGLLTHIHIKKCYVHDVNGNLEKSTEGCGIFITTSGGNDSRFHDTLIQDCHLVRVDRNGICQRGCNGSTSFVVRGNLLEDIGGDAIKPWGSHKPLVEYNIVRGARTRTKGYAAGIWPWDCEGAVIQYNEVSGMVGNMDGQSFDSDYRCRDSLFQYNYSHNNGGGFFLICSTGSSYNTGTVIRYNISQDDGGDNGRIFHITGNGVEQTSIYNNVIYVGSRFDLPMIHVQWWENRPPIHTAFYNNIFYVDGKVSYKDLDKAKNLVFSNNVFYGNHTDRPADPNGIDKDPGLVNPGSGGHGFETLEGYKLINKSVCIGTGKLIDDNGGRDFWGNNVSDSKLPDIGVFSSLGGNEDIIEKIRQNNIYTKTEK